MTCMNKLPGTPGAPEFKFEFGVKGRFILELHKEGGEKRKVAEFDNLITNSGLDTLVVGTIQNFCCVGSGSTTPATTDTKLASLVAIQGSPSAAVSNSGSPNYATTYTTTYNYGVGAAAGNLTEIGVCSSSNISTYITYTRALILDGLGNPTTITVLSDEYLTVTYNLTVVPTLTDSIQTVSGYTLTLRPAYVGTAAANSTISNAWYAAFLGTFISPATVNLYTDSIAAVTSGPSTSSLNCSSVSAATYISGTYYRDLTATWTPASGTINANSIRLGLNGPVFQIGISPTLAKTTSTSFNITVRFSLVRI